MIGPCIASLMTTFAALEPVGIVLDYFPLDAKTGALARAAFTAEGEVNCCVVRRKLADEDGSSQNYATCRHTLWIEYVRRAGGSPEQQAFDAALDALLASLKQDARLNGTVVSRSPASLKESEPRYFFKWLCLYGRIELTVETLM